MPQVTKKRRARGHRHIQIEMLSQDGTRPRDPRGGKRVGSGRKPKGRRAGVSHAKREKFTSPRALHINTRVHDAVGALRKMDIYRALRLATIAAAKSDKMRIVHLSLQGTHVHLIVEAESKLQLSRGMQGFMISAAKWINAALTKRTGKKRKGSVFSDRYHAELISSPAQARRALAYVLNNWRKHREDRGEYADHRVDKFSTGVLFDGWKERAGLGPWPIPLDYQPLVVWKPRLWLLREGWRRHGLISVREVPGRIEIRPRGRAHPTKVTSRP